ncbi:MAG: glycosyltransferase [Candidatus Eisenbacteria bacterium]
MFPRLSETFVTNELLELKRRGLDVRVLSLLPPTGAVQSEESRALLADTIQVPHYRNGTGFASLVRSHRRLLRRDAGRYLRTFGLVARRFSGSAWKRFLQAGAVAEWCLDNEVRHLHAGFAHVPASVVWWASRLTGIPWSFAAHAKDLYLSDRRSLRNKMDAARFVWTCTEANGRYLRSLGSATDVHVGYHGVDLERFGPPLHPTSREGSGSRAGGASMGDGPPTILAVGRLVPKKGFDDLLRAAAILQEKRLDFRLVFVGDGPQRGPLTDLAGRLGVAGRARFLGSLPPDQVSREYAGARLLVLPSIVLDNGDRDGIPNVLVEAMAMGVPVVSTRVSAIPELIRDGENGLLVDPGAPAQLARAIDAVLEDAPAAAGRAARARLDVAERFDLHANSGALAELLRRHCRATRALYVSADLGVPVRGHKGASAHVRAIANGLVEAGLAVRVVTPSAGEEASEGGNRFDPPIDIVSCPRWAGALVDRSRERRSLYAWAKEVRRLAWNGPMHRRVQQLLSDFRPDFVYERYSLCSIATGLACRRRRVPWLLEVNAPLADEEAAYRGLRFRWLTRRLERWILRHADHVFVVSHPLRRWALDAGVSPERLSVLPNAVDTGLFRPGVPGVVERRRSWEWSEEEIIVGFAGSLKPWHGGALLLAAFERAMERDPRLRLCIIGDGPERKEIERRARRRGLASVVRLTGAVPQREVPSMLRACDILVAPYLPQPNPYFSPLKVLEYLAVGRPVLASRIADLPDLVTPECGLLLPPGDRAALRDAILDLARDPRRREAMGKAAADRAAREDWSGRVRTILLEARQRRSGGAARPPATSTRVAYVLKMFPRFSETFIVSEIVELERQGLEIRVFSMKQPAGRRQDDVDRVRARVSVLPCGLAARGAVPAAIRCLIHHPRGSFRAFRFAVGRRDHRALVKLWQAAFVADRSRREGIGHLHAHFASGPTRVAKLASMISGIPFSFTAHAKDLYWSGHQHTESHKLKKRVKLARFVVSVSKRNEDFLGSLGFRVKEGRIRTIYLGLRLEEFPFVPPSARPSVRVPLILAVGRLVEKKGFHPLIEALATLRDRGVAFRCIVAGEGPEKDRLQDRIRTARLAGRVRLAGPVPLTRLKSRLYPAARVLAQPCVVSGDGDQDGIPIVLMEAMASGLPIVSTRVSGIPEAIEDGVEGFLTEPGDVEALAGRIEQLLTRPILAERIAHAARARAERQFNLHANVGSLRKLFLRSLAGWPAPAVPPGISRPAERSEAGAEAGIAPSGIFVPEEETAPAQAAPAQARGGCVSAAVPAHAEAALLAGAPCEARGQSTASRAGS